MQPLIQPATVAANAPSFPDFEPGDSSIRTHTVYVVHTTVDETLEALRVAASFAMALGVPVTLLHLRTVPYALAIDAPHGISPLETDAFLDRLRAQSQDVRVRVHLCRSERDAVHTAVVPHSLVVVGGHHRKWRRILEGAGHYVVQIDAASLKEKFHA